MLWYAWSKSGLHGGEGGLILIYLAAEGGFYTGATRALPPLLILNAAEHPDSQHYLFVSSKNSNTFPFPVISFDRIHIVEQNYMWLYVLKEQDNQSVIWIVI